MIKKEPYSYGTAGPDPRVLSAVEAGAQGSSKAAV